MRLDDLMIRTTISPGLVTAVVVTTVSKYKVLWTVDSRLALLEGYEERVIIPG
jgi:hypothetical protein